MSLHALSLMLFVSALPASFAQATCTFVDDCWDIWRPDRNCYYPPCDVAPRPLSSLQNGTGAIVLASADDDGRTIADEVHELHERLEDAIDEGFDAAGEYLERSSEEAHSGCNNSDLGERTREALGC